ncbi:MAG: M18 family aminopeptidase [Propionibacteriaceae bacterium]|nr:M18 family aminopeptidase [Propionibacteriaceae bacterium]
MEFVDFLAASPTSYHACAAVARMLEDAGFTQQREDSAWETGPGGRYVIRDGAIIAYRIPERATPATSFRIVGAHTDSPTFKLKPHPQHTSVGWSQAGMEVYGGPLLNSWLDREFGLAGRVHLRSGEQRLIATGPWLRIPQLAPHLDRSVNEALRLDKQQHLMPIFAMAGDGVDLMEAVAEAAGCRRDEIRGHDLFAHIVQPPEVFGSDSQFLAAGRLDDLSSVHPGVQALITATPGEGVVPVLACFDHEEVGSQTRSGAGGSFLDDVLARVSLGWGLSEDEAHRARARSFVVSADAGHAVHPNYPGMHDPDEQPLMGAGPMLKVNAQQRYTTDGAGQAMWESVCEQAGVPCQTFVSNNAVSCGTTIGPIISARLGLATVDVGIPLLSMHSAREMCSPTDVDHLASALTVFFGG